MTATDDVRLVLLERPGCHLCVAAREVMARIAAETGLRWVSVDVDDSSELQAAWGELIPVVLVDGVEAGYWHLDAARILARLDSRSALDG